MANDKLLIMHQAVMMLGCAFVVALSRLSFHTSHYPFVFACINEEKFHNAINLHLAKLLTPKAIQMTGIFLCVCATHVCTFVNAKQSIKESRHP